MTRFKRTIMKRCRDKGGAQEGSLHRQGEGVSGQSGEGEGIDQYEKVGRHVQGIEEHRERLDGARLRERFRQIPGWQCHSHRHRGSIYSDLSSGNATLSIKHTDRVELLCVAHRSLFRPQCQNLVRLCELAVQKCCALNRISLLTTYDTQEQIARLAELKESLATHRISFNFSFSETLHDRQIS